MHKSEIADAISQSLGVSHEQGADILNELLEAIALALSKGDSVTLAGFGSFQRTHHQARRGRHPRTGAPIDVPAGYSVRFRPGKTLREKVAGTGSPGVQAG